ncbi:MAG: hypothetical protein COS39_01320 [Hydrogenophilales bacterium CG03_land_8_20_14_0_80_62_28]|nr:TonB-dependent receptor [Betaproteobacteria bacterium]OIO79832.1 MAG: hypothetical protein AUJ86_00930 [Hydrogenophilaceae bacterium CG1_02_62_390]PIV24319.1 MAG: hypothetical protein COS39_01320 [Hydrogenophilales bacterium CG03_land_8_20_14_0_80_62_28]PIW38416.1 MAG: hypothetical protein COW23_06540 [Hydrogenophilales bacterium CG15_BIG_FIL_POST_REV_8_21_14_020_62_31]PIW71862.1 MAG: hypothetical protein COW07_05860 [Hydrogenophilales bacterium CG12_big_fil_rev_8_21_14_0_65_61_21]PIX01438.
MSPHIVVLLIGLLLSLTVHGEGIAGAATVVDLQGQVEYRSAPGAAWRAVDSKQKLRSGQTVRTGPHSRVALLLDDRTQVRLNEKTVLELQSLQVKPRSPGQTVFRQLLGRAWVQSKTPPKQFTWQTPTAVAGLRGTDWEMEVAEDGRSRLSVFSGQVDIYNDLGRVAVAANEQALVEPGKAPIKLVVQNLRARVQWVTAYRVDPLRHVVLDGASLPDLRQRLSETGATDPATRVQRGRILADLGRWRAAENEFDAARQARPGAADAMLGLAYVALHDNNVKGAADWLHRSQALKASEAWVYADIGRMILSQDISGALAVLQTTTQRNDLKQPVPWLLLSDLAIQEGQVEAALEHIRQGLQRFPADPRLYAQQARLLLSDDQAVAAARAAEQAIDADLASYDAWLARADIARREGDVAAAFPAYDLAIGLKPDDDRAWYGRGTAYGEREYVRQARADLAQALALNQTGAGYQGELGALETFANEFAQAETAYRLALAGNPADFVALTGLGVLELKLGHPQRALDALLKAGVMEPRYARVHVYSAVAYYQVGEIEAAQQELVRAGQLDDKDPLPHFMAALIRSDLMRPAAAVESARQAMRRLPFLKSLNQLANDQQGSANLGQAFAFMGMEEWARSYAQESYNPFWAGSHLFLADRYDGLFSKNSELFQGLISDPTVFGAGNRFRSLIPGPADNLNLGLRYSRSDSLDGFSPQVEYSGYRVAPKPLAWYLGYENVNWNLFDRPYDLNVFTAAFGIKPRHDYGLFVFADGSRQDSQPVGELAGFGGYDGHDRLDSRRLDIGFNRKLAPTSQVWLKAGYFTSAEDTSGILGGDPIVSRVDVSVPEFAFRHGFETDGGHRIAWGADYGLRRTDGLLRSDMFASSGLPDYWIQHADNRIRERSLDIYFSDSYRLDPKLLLEWQIAYQQHDRQADSLVTDFILDTPGTPLPMSESLNTRQISPRLGLVYRANEQLRLRFAWQNWIRPSTFSSLGPVATAGITLDDRLVSRGGELNRVRLQGEWETNPRTFLTGYLDYRDIDNHRLGIRPFAVSELESLGKLRPRDYGALMRGDLYEFVDTPDYAGGTIQSAGIAVNRMLNSEWAAIARYIYTDSHNSTDTALAIPYLPRHTVAVGATWVNPNGWYVAGLLTHRSRRYQGEANTLPLNAGFGGALDIFRESRDKHWLARFSSNDMFDRNRATQYTMELNYRF